METFIKELCSQYECHGLKIDSRDIARFLFCESLISGNSILDIGCGPGFLTNILAYKDRISEIYAFDIVPHSKLIKNDKTKYIYGDLRRISSLPSVDVVVCMEVLEHLESKYTDSVLQKMRSTARRRLILTVPFNEPEPLWWHDRPGGHRQSFDLTRLEKLFPNAYATIFKRYTVDWIFIVENFDGIKPPSFFLLENNELISVLN